MNKSQANAAKLIMKDMPEGSAEWLEATFKQYGVKAGFDPWSWFICVLFNMFDQYVPRQKPKGKSLDRDYTKKLPADFKPFHDDQIIF